MGTNYRWNRALGRALLVCGLVGGTSIALSPLAQASSGGTLYVNGGTGSDTGTCRLSSHPCKTITYALSQASAIATSTIRVAGGNYPEALAINKSVTIIGAGATATSGNNFTPTVIDPSMSALVTDTDPNHSSTPEVIVDVNGTTGVTLKNMAVSGTNAQSQFGDCTKNFMGVYFHNASGSMNLMAVTGIQLPTALFGCQDGLGVYVASDTGASSVSMNGLTVNTFDKNGITCRDAATSCTVTNSHVTGIGPTSLIAQNGIEGYGVASITLTNDTVKKDSYTGGGPGNSATGLLVLDVGTVSATSNHLSLNDINGYFGDDGSGPPAGTWTITGNTVSGATDNVTGGPQAGYGDGIVLDSTTNPVTISSNTVTTSKEFGIALYGASNAQVTGNTVTGSKSDGIYVGGPGSAITSSSGNTISTNTSNSNDGDGIHADANSAGNTFSGNTTHYNLLYDLEDGAAPGSNTWSSDTCLPANDSNPAGLCS
jgi:parallel beta-helix repeat protein